MMIPSDIREIDGKSKFLFFYCCGIKKAVHNTRWMMNRGLPVDIYIPTVINHIEVAPFIVVTKNHFYKIRDPHIKEHNWEKITIEELFRKGGREAYCTCLENK